MVASDEREVLRQRAEQLDTQLRGTEEKLRQVDEVLQQRRSDDDQRAEELAQLRAELKELQAPHGLTDSAPEKKQAPTKTPIALWRLVPTTVAVSVAWLALICLSATYTHPVAAFFVAAPVGLFGISVCGARWGGETAALIGVAAMLSLTGAVAGPSVVAAVFGHGVDISVRDIESHLGADWYHFRDGEVKTAYHGNHVYEVDTDNGTKKKELAVAPLVTTSWKTADPILAWVACPQGYRSCTENWSKSLRAAYSIQLHRDSMQVSSRLELARKNSEQQFKLRSAARAPFLIWTADPKADIIDGASVAIVVPTLGYLIALLVVAYRRFSRWRKTR